MIVVRDYGGILYEVEGLKLKSLKRAVFYDTLTVIERVFKNRSRSEDNFQT